MSEPDYSILIGADGEDGLVGLIKLIRFDEQMQVYMVPVLITDETFEVKSSNDNDIKHKYTLWRKVSLRQKNKQYSTEIFYSKEVDRYYISVSRIAHMIQPRTKHFLQHNINGKYGNYFLENINGQLGLVKVLSV